MTEQELKRANELVRKQNQIKDMMEMAKTSVIIRKPVIRGLRNIFGEEVADSYFEEVNNFAENKLSYMLHKKYEEITEELEKI